MVNKMEPSKLLDTVLRINLIKDDLQALIEGKIIAYANGLVILRVKGNSR